MNSWTIRRATCRIIALAVFAVGAAACDVVASKYANLDEARKDRLFERGWLPEILPTSTTNIVASNNLDLNTSEGAFRFAPGDSDELRQRTQQGAPAAAPVHGWSSKRESRRLEGFSEYSYQEGGSSWVFFCKFDQGLCEYTMWKSQPRSTS
jgi:hypothetical protein